MSIGKIFECMTIKKMSKIENSFYNNLRQGLDNQIIIANNFLDTAEYNQLNNEGYMDEQLFSDTSLYDDLNILMQNNVLSNERYVVDFYNRGSRLGYRQLNKSLPFNKYDEQSLGILKKYDEELFYDLNYELAFGIRDILCDSINENKNKNDTKSKLLNLMMVPIISNINIDMRSEMIARTEHSRGINTGTLQAYSNCGVCEANIITSGMSNVCDDCLELEQNNPYSLEEAAKLIPFHPFCNCSYTPITSSIKTDDEIIIVDLTEE